MKVAKVTINAASVELGIDERTLTRLMVVGGFKVGRGKKFRWRDILRSTAADPRIERAKESRARRELLELEFGERRNELISTDEAMLIWGKVLLVVRQRLASLPHEAAAPANPTDPAHAFKALTEWADSSARQIDQHLPPMATAGKAEDEVDVKSQCASRTTTG